jgi:hypothetical protein
VTDDPIIHRQGGPFAGHEIAEEYALPAHHINLRRSAAIDPWVKRFIGTSAEGARGLLERRWKGIVDTPLLLLREWLLRLEPSSILLFKNDAWIGVKLLPDIEEPSEPPPWVISLRKYLTPPGFDSSSFFQTYGDTACRTYFIPPPLDRASIRQRLSELSFPRHKLLVSFLHFFAGLREDTPLISGNFLCHDSKDWMLMLQDKDDVEGFDEWQRGLMLYHARNGDGVIVHPRGRVGWWIFSEARIEGRYADLGEFVQCYVDRLDSKEPFDSYTSDLK